MKAQIKINLSILLQLTAQEAYLLKGFSQNPAPEDGPELLELKRKIWEALPSFDRLIEWLQQP